MKYIKTFESRDMRHYYINFDYIESNLTIIYNIIQKLKDDKIKYNIFRVNDKLKIYFKSDNSYIYNKYCIIFDYIVSDNYDLTNHIQINEEDIPLCLNTNKFNL